MTFIIRQITRRAKGDDIVRDRELDQDEVSVGRATHNDIFLSDLRVALDHLVIFISGTRVMVEGVSGQRFTVNGRDQSKLSLSNGQTEIIGVGPFELSFDQDSQRQWRVSVERVEAEDALVEDNVDEIFTLRGTFLGKRLPAWAGFLAAIFLFLAAPVIWFYGFVPNEVNDVVDLDAAWLSGPLAGAHSNLEADCKSCHVAAFNHVDDATCIECHDDLNNHAEPALLTASLPSPQGWDGAMLQTASFFGKEQGECADCHREHNSDEGLILEASRLCTSCHLGIDERIETDIAEAGSFTNSHPNFHVNLVKTPGPEPIFHRVMMGGDDVADNSGLKFPHDIHLEASGNVARQAQDLSAEFGFGEALVCADCHSLDKDGLIFQQVEMEANCQMCHALDLPDPAYARELPHGEPEEVVEIVQAYYRTRTITSLIQPDGSVRRRPGSSDRVRRQPRQQSAAVDAEAIANDQVAQIFDEKGSCGICHEVIPAPAGTVDYDILPVTLVDKFMLSADFDHDSHDIGDLTCDSCHEAKWSDSASHVLLPQIDTVAGLPGGGDVIGCRDCHGDETAKAPLVASACLDCHGYHDGTHAPLMTAGAPMEFDPARWGRIPEAADLR